MAGAVFKKFRTPAMKNTGRSTSVAEPQTKQTEKTTPISEPEANTEEAAEKSSNPAENGEATEESGIIEISYNVTDPRRKSLQPQ